MIIYNLIISINSYLRYNRPMYYISYSSLESVHSCKVCCVGTFELSTAVMRLVRAYGLTSELNPICSAVKVHIKRYERRVKLKKSKELMRKMIAMFLIVLLGLSSLGNEVFAVEVVNETELTDTIENAVVPLGDNIKILMVGNSLTRYNSVADKLEQLFAYAGKQATVDTRTQMGASLIDQAEILATSTREAIVYGDYDYIVLQEKSSGFTEALLRQGVGAFDPWIQEAESHPQLVLYMPWANEDVFKSMQTTFTNAYVKVAKDYGALLAPSGEAYYDLYFNEGKDWYRNGDNVHGNDLASLISASTLFYTISGQEQPILQIREEDQPVVKALVESSDYRNYTVNYDRDIVNLIERKAYAFTNTYRDLNNVPDLTGRGIDATVNLAKQKQGSASSNARGATRGIGARNVANITDGSYTSFMTLHEEDPDPWFAVDLDVKTAFNQLTLYWGGTGDYADSYKAKFTIEGTNDPAAGYVVITTGESTSTNKQVIRFTGVEYQYVRVHVTEKNGAYASLYELEIYNLPSQEVEDPNTDIEVNVGDYLQVQVGDSLTNMSLYEKSMYEAKVAFPQGVKDYKILCNGESIYKGAVTESNVEQNIIIRIFATDNKVVTGQDVHKDVNGNPVQDIKKVANWTGNFFNRTGIEEFKAFGGWDQANPLSTLNYLGGGIFARELTYTVPEASVSYEYKINFDGTWNNGEIPSANRKVVFPASEKETDTFVIWVNSVRGDIFDSINDGSTTFKIEGNNSYIKTIGTAKVELSLNKEENNTLYSMVQTGKNAYMVTAFLETGTYTWVDKIDDNDGTLSGAFTVDKNTAVTFYYSVSEDDYVMLNTIDNATEFLKATTPGDDTTVVNPPDDENPVINPPIVVTPVAQAIDLGKATVTLDKTTYTYDGETKVPAVTVVLEGKTLSPAKDYIITYANTTNAGAASVTIMGTGDYTGTVVKEYSIKAKSIIGMIASLSAASYTYDGKAKEPTVTLMNSSSTLKNNTDYTVTYSNNTKTGEATVKITGIGNYTDIITKNFTIKQHSNTIKVTSKYTKTASSKAQMITLGAKATGGKLTYKSDNSKVTVSSTGKVTIKANFSGKAVITVTAGDTNYKTVTKKVTITVNPAKVKSNVKSVKVKK